MQSHYKCNAVKVKVTAKNLRRYKWLFFTPLQVKSTIFTLYLYFYSFSYFLGNSTVILLGADRPKCL